MPRIDRVIIALTANPVYTGFWNYVAGVWRNKFHVKPTLIFYGSDAEFEAFHRTAALGDFVHLPRVDAVTLNREREWACTWGLFYGAAQFPDEVCMLAGIDQVPLNGAFLDRIRPLAADHYLVGLADAYAPANNPDAIYPSSHHVAQGCVFRKVFDLETSWPDEVQKVFASRSAYYLPDDGWGLDEAYSSQVLRKRARTVGDVEFCNTFWVFFHTTRLWRGKDRLDCMDFEGIRAGRYSEWHADRPFEGNDPAALERLAQSIPEYSW